MGRLINVKIMVDGKILLKVTRPLRLLNGKPAITFKKQLLPVTNECEVHLDNFSKSAYITKDVCTTKETQQSINWDELQRQVIEAESDDRLLVNAGPGTGKTAVACARVAYLIDNKNIQAGNIWLISFTRTAVTEIRNRMASYLKDDRNAYAVKIATLDSHAWAIHSGFDDNAKILGTYEENIQSVIKIIKNGDDELLDYFESVQHIIIDEAQDIVGIRADLVIEIIEKLSKSCGITVFSDDAQAIYGFADEDKPNHSCTSTLSTRIRENTKLEFVERELLHVHRTKSNNLIKIFADLRHKVLSCNSAENKLATILKEVRLHANEKISENEKLKITERNDCFILFRRRSDVLLFSSLIQNKAHRIRMSGLPVSIVPWIGATLSNHTSSTIDEKTFSSLWSNHIENSALSIFDYDSSWKLLVRLAGKSNILVDLKLLRHRLGRKQPPAEMCSMEIGYQGPIVGTIHACKGREAESVHLMLPYENTCSEEEQFEEAKVVFVGATRSKSKLLVGSGFRQYSDKVENTGRVYSCKTKSGYPRAQVEIGRSGDMFPEGLAGKKFFRSSQGAAICQTRILSYYNKNISLNAECDQSSDYHFWMREEDNYLKFAFFSRALNNDLFVIRDHIQKRIKAKLRPPNKIPYLYIKSIGTIVLPPDSPDSQLLHEPWASSGFLLCPIIFGYSTIYFPYKKKGYVN